MPVTPQPVSDYNVLNAYLLLLVGTTENLEIQHIFRFCDKAVCSKLLHIIRNNRDEFKKVIPIMGRFHQLLCLQKVIYERYACLGLETWITGARTTKPVSAAEKTVQGLHYNTATPADKEIFDAIVHMQNQNIENNYNSIDEVLKQNLVKLTKNTDISNVANVLRLCGFKKLKEKIVHSNNRQYRMTVMLLKRKFVVIIYFSNPRI